jgi:hypothetical protein
MREGVEIVVLECLLIFGALHEFGNGILTGIRNEDNMLDESTYTSHELEDRHLGFFK